MQYNPDMTNSDARVSFFRRAVMPACFCTALMIMEFAVRANTEDVIPGIGILYTILFSVTAGLILYLLISASRGILRKTLTLVILGTAAILYSSQLIYYEVFRTFYTVFSAMEGGGQILQFYREILQTIAGNLHWIGMIFLPFAGMFFLPHDFEGKKRPGPLFLCITAVIAAAVFIAAIVSINRGSREANSPYDMYYRNAYPNYSVMQLGLMTTMRLDVQRSLFGFRAGTDDPGMVLTPTDIPSPSPSGPQISQEITPVPSASPSPEPEYNILDIDFVSLENSAGTEQLKLAHRYFGSLAPTQKNAYTGIFKGYNLVLITAESYSHLAVDKDITPTFYKMTHEGMNFTDFYNPYWPVSTSDGEYVATTGLIPKPGVWSMKISGSKYMPFAMGNQHLKLGYVTYAYHNHYYDYYGRDVSHPNLGYIYKGYGSGLKMTDMWPESDIEMMQLSIPDFISSEKFHAYYMTVSGHLAYNFFGNQMAVKNRALVEDLDYTEAARAYLATQIEFDRALEYLLEELEKAGIAEKTLIVVSADHYPYGLKKEDIDDLAGHTVESNFELYKSSLLIYVKGMEPLTIDRPVSSLDIIPTISNLLGIEYDSRLLMGTDIFSEATPLVIFNNRSFITDKGRYDSPTKEFVSATGSGPEEGYVEAILDSIEKKFYFSAKILDLDYYAEVLPRQ